MSNNGGDSPGYDGSSPGYIPRSPTRMESPSCEPSDEPQSPATPHSKGCFIPQKPMPSLEHYGQRPFVRTGISDIASRRTGLNRPVNWKRFGFWNCKCGKCNVFSSVSVAETHVGSQTGCSHAQSVYGPDFLENKESVMGMHPVRLMLLLLNLVGIHQPHLTFRQIFDVIHQGLSWINLTDLEAAQLGPALLPSFVEMKWLTTKEAGDIKDALEVYVKSHDAVEAFYEAVEECMAYPSSPSTPKRLVRTREEIESNPPSAPRKSARLRRLRRRNEEDIDEELVRFEEEL